MGQLQKTPKLQSIRRQVVEYHGLTSDESEREDSSASDQGEVITHLLRTGSMNGPVNATAIARWANASQSVP